MNKTDTGATHDISVAELSFEQAFSELEEIVIALEMDQKSLENTIILFERGQALASHCANLLDHAELKIQQLTDEDVDEFKLPE